MSSPYSRSLPATPDLAQQKKQAKELLAAFTAGDAQSIARVRAALPDKKRITLADTQFVLAREYGFPGWAALRRHIADRAKAKPDPEAEVRAAFHQRDAVALRRLLEHHPEFRQRIDAPVFGFNSPAIVAYADDLAMVDVLLDFGANPNARSEWWAGGFHPLHSATGPAADRLIAAGAVPDACAAANLDRPDLLKQILDADPARVHERGGDGKTPLHFARSRTVADMLLAAGADIDARDVDHRATPAEWMLDRRRDAGRYDLAAWLVARGAHTDIFLAAALGLTHRVRTMLDVDPSLLDLRTGQGEYGERPPSSYHIYFWTIGDSRSPLEVAEQFGHRETVDAMLAVASPLQRFLFACRAGDEQRAQAILREHPGLIATMSPSDHRALPDAAWNGQVRAVELMLQLGFDPRARGHDSGSALHIAAWEGSSTIVAVLLRHPDARALVALKDAHYGATPLGWCCHGSAHGNAGPDHVGVAKMLLDAGAQPGEDTVEASAPVKAVIDAWRRARGANTSP